VIGIEPNADMLARAEARPMPGVEYRQATSDATALPTASADVVVAVQALHWMEPVATLREVARILRPGGVFAALDADWPPVAGLHEAELAWQHFHRRMRVFEARAARGERDGALRAPIDDDDPALHDEDLRDPHRNRALPDGVRSWSKAEHLDRIQASGHFAFARELVFDEPSGGTAGRFVALMRSQGSYQALRRLGLDDDEMGATEFDRRVRDAYARADVTALPELSFAWRARLGVTAIDGVTSAPAPAKPPQ
jgi:SAM-dependent methyltransferase